MRLTKSIGIAVSTLALSAGAAFAGEGAIDRSDSRGYQPNASSYEQGGPEQLSGPQDPSMNSMDEYSMQNPEYSPLPSDEDQAESPVLGNERG